jgi:lysophospholipase L1-like esterase
MVSRRELVGRFSLLALSSLLCLGTAEIALRLIGTDGRAPPSRHVQLLRDGAWEDVGVWGTAGVKRAGSIPETQRLGEYIPNSTFRFAYFDLDRVQQDGDPRWQISYVQHHINAQGLRGPVVTAEKPPGEFRLLSVGDSFTFGDGVEDGETFTAQLEPLLNAGTPSEASGGPVVRTINAGVSGANTRHEVAWLKHFAPRLDPDLVLIVFYINDAYDDERFGMLTSGGAAGAFHLNAQSSDAALWSVRFLENRLGRYLLSRKVVGIYKAQFSDRPMLPGLLSGHDWGGSRVALAEARRWADTAGVKLALVIFPELHALNASHPFTSIHRTVRNFGERVGIPTLDLLPTFLGHKPRELWVHLSDHHPNATAHAMAAESIAAFLKQRGLLPAGL